MGFTHEPKKVQGKGTAYPVGSPRHQSGTPEPVFHEVGPVNVPQPHGTVELQAEFTEAQLVGLVLRTCRMDPGYEALVELVEDMEPSDFLLAGAYEPDLPYVIVVRYAL
jgi:hypothetical protein